ncbi:amylo-alpha-1,6-glucosidase [Nocardia arthritidis]|uniref:Amylo-alpha-1,6-glucosidase n=1 Tax=Nocardia arthritidis TaxID=228602 RepID=A0A6G9YN13_9NOCA|nr:glycogen debranching N-terminal domain-containing protein [Nocardia arthritidis]QIS14510.1 amylo-alpha-1,6-glucosidase [Nocardia arthritidis]
MPEDSASRFDDDPVASVVGDAGVVTLVEHRTFCVSDRSGDIEPGAQYGLFYRHRRVLSRWELRLAHRCLQSLTVLNSRPFAARFLLRRTPWATAADSTMLVVRERTVDEGMRETITLVNTGSEPSAVTVELRVDGDFADPYAVKDGRVSGGRAEMIVADGELVLVADGAHAHGVSISSSRPALVRSGMLIWRVVVPAGERWRTEIRVAPTHPAAYRTDQPTAPRRTGEWRETPTSIAVADPVLTRVLRRSESDLSVLQIRDGGHRFVAAGAPWYMSLFGRDSLLTAWMALPLDVGLAVETLELLAGLQGARVDPFRDEEPGRIMHGIRRHQAVTEALGGEPYYGTVDATPLFVMLLAEARRWGADRERVRALLPAADAALDWIARYGDRDRDGFVEYRRASDRGLADQGWKDSEGSINDAAGRAAEPPVALCEVQGYVYAALLGRAALAAEFGDRAGAARMRERAAELRAHFDETFWLPEKGWYAVALDRDKRPLDALTSNITHCMWTGIATDEHAARMIDRLAEPDMDSGFGLRTLAATMGAFNPMSYHNGSIWPHDNAIAVAGLLRYRHLPGAIELATRLADGLLDSAAAFGGRLPELFCGFQRSDFEAPVPYPAACSPQAWASAAPLLLVRSFLGLDPDVPGRLVTVRPQVPKRWGAVEFSDLRLGAAAVRLRVDGDRVDADLPDGWRLES